MLSQPKDTFEGVPFAVLGLGDTNYDKFCYMGKCIDKRLNELGGKRLIELYCGDEGTGLEETIEAWKKTSLATVRKVYTESLSESKLELEPDDEEKLGEEYRNLSIDGTGTTVPSELLCSTNSPCTDETGEYSHVHPAIKMPENILTANEVAGLLGLTEKLSTPPTAAQLPRAKACIEAKCPYKFTTGDTTTLSTILPCVDSCTSLKSRPTSEPGAPYEALWTADNPFHATVTAAKWLTQRPTHCKESEQWGEARRVIHLELGLSGSEIVYSPGDSIGICCPNAPYAVDIVLQRLQTAHSELSLTLDTVVTCTADSSLTTLQELLSYKYDLMGPPKKAVLVTLSACCTDPAEATLMQHLCSKGEVGKSLWEKFVEFQRVGVAELLALFPSCTPRLHQLLSCLTPLPPRYYSISSSPLAGCCDRLSIAFSMVRYTCMADIADAAITPIKRSGLCTTYMQHILRPLLSKRISYEDICRNPNLEIKVRMFHKVSTHFHLPGSVAPPLILIGPGTGVAPFMGFLEHRQQLTMERRRSGSEDCCMGMWRGGFEMEEEDLPVECGGVSAFIQTVEPGPIYLFFGCRDENDYLYRSELEEYLCTRTLTELDVAMSRVGPEKVYVTHKLRERGAEMARLILDDAACIYICGDGNHMAKDVYASIKAILVEHGNGMTEESVEALLQDMKLRRRYILDIWS